MNNAGSNLYLSLFIIIFTFVKLEVTSFEVKPCSKFGFYLSLKLDKDGFHRDLRYEIEYQTHLRDIDKDVNPEGWIVAVRHEMPSGLYINPDEVNGLKAFDMIDANVLGHVNVEMQASYDSEGLGGTAIIYSVLENHKATLWAPVHARYHPPRPNGGFTAVFIEPGTLFIRSNSSADKAIPCGRKIRLPCSSKSNAICDWWDIKYLSLTDNVEWLVPIGNLSHFFFICGVTLFITLAGCLYVASSIFSTAQILHRGRRKAQKYE